MATQKKPAAPVVMEATMEEFGTILSRTRTDLTLLIQGEQGKFNDVVEDFGALSLGIGELIRGWVHPTVGSPEKLAECRTNVAAECDQMMQMLQAEHPRFVESGAGGSLTEGAKIEKLIQIGLKLLPFIKFFFV